MTNQNLLVFITGWSTSFVAIELPVIQDTQTAAKIIFAAVVSIISQLTIKFLSNKIDKHFKNKNNG